MQKRCQAVELNLILVPLPIIRAVEVNGPHHSTHNVAGTQRVSEARVVQVRIYQVCQAQLLHIVETLENPRGDDIGFELANTERPMYSVGDAPKVESRHRRSAQQPALLERELRNRDLRCQSGLLRFHDRLSRSFI